MNKELCPYCNIQIPILMHDEAYWQFHLNGHEEKSKADSLYETLKNNPKEIIQWCEREIAEYEKLIKLIKTND